MVMVWCDPPSFFLRHTTSFLSTKYILRNVVLTNECSTTLCSNVFCLGKTEDVDLGIK